MDPLDRVGPVNPYEPPRTQHELDPTAIYRTEGIDLSKENPFFTIWTRPRATIRGIVNINPAYLVILLTIASGIVQALNDAVRINAGDNLSLQAVLVTALVRGSIGGLIFLYVGAWFVGLSSSWLGGRADSGEVRAAMAWSSVPIVATIPIWLIQLAVAGREMFTTEMPNVVANPALSVFMIVTTVIEVLLAIWSFVLFLKTLGEVQGFSAWRALASLFLIMVIVLVPIVLLVTSLSR